MRLSMQTTSATSSFDRFTYSPHDRIPIRMSADRSPLHQYKYNVLFPDLLDCLIPPQPNRCPQLSEAQVFNHPSQLKLVPSQLTKRRYSKDPFSTPASAPVTPRSPPYHHLRHEHSMDTDITKYLDYLQTHRNKVLAPWIAGPIIDIFAAGIYCSMLFSYFSSLHQRVQDRREGYGGWTEQRKRTFLICVVAALSAYKTATAIYILFLNAFYLNGNPSLLAFAAYQNWVCRSFCSTIRCTSMRVKLTLQLGDDNSPADSKILTKLLNCDVLCREGSSN